MILKCKFKNLQQLITLDKVPMNKCEALKSAERLQNQISTFHKMSKEVVTTVSRFKTAESDQFVSTMSDMVKTINDSISDHMKLLQVWQGNCRCDCAPSSQQQKYLPYKESNNNPYCKPED